MPPINPYITGDPVGNSPIFVGRDNILREVLKILHDPAQNAITLFGQRRVGKTSMLQFLQIRLPQEGEFQTVYFDLQDKSEWPLSRILLGLANAVVDRLNLTDPIPPITEDTFIRWLENILASMPENASMVLLFDEFDVLADSQSGVEAADFFLYLRKLLTLNPTRLKFVLVLGRNFTDLGTVALAAFKGITSRRISLLNKSDTLKLIKLSEQGKATLEWPVRAAEIVWNLTHGHPYLTQALCSQVWEAAYSNDIPQTAPKVTPEMVESAVDAALDTSRNTLEWLWGGLGPAEKVISAALSGAGNQVVDETRLEQLLRESGVRILIRELQNAPELLIKNWDILEPVSGGYVFKVEILRRWIERYHSLKRTQDELDRIQPAADSLFQAAQVFYDQGNLNDAEKLLNQAIGVNPNHLRANELLAEILIGLNRLGEARDLLERLFELVPNNARPRLIQVCLDQAQNTGDSKTRLELYGRVLELDATRPEALAGVEKIRKDEENEQRLTSNFLNGRQALQRGEWNTAIELLQQVVASRPSYSYDGDTAADLLAQAVKGKEHPSPRWKVLLLRPQTWVILVAILIGSFIFGIGQRMATLGATEAIGPFWWLAPSTSTPTLTATLYLSPTSTGTLIPTSTVTLPPLDTPSPVPPGAFQIRSVDGMEMIYIPSGTFTMGSRDGWFDERPEHQVQLDAFWMDKTEVTNAMYILFLNAYKDKANFQRRDREIYFNGNRIFYVVRDGSVWDQIGWNEKSKEYYLKDKTFASHPAINVTWYGASEYCTWVDGRLPTEAEWEYAARGTDKRFYPWGNIPPNIQLTNFNNEVGVTTIVGGYIDGASPFGILDMAGNVSEWVHDRYGNNYYQRPISTNPGGPDIGDYRVLRGGSWRGDNDTLRAWSRYKLTPTKYGPLYGFRCADYQ